MQHLDIFEEKVEFSNVTRFRKLLLSVLDRLQENHYLRYVITKHGEPKAVVMSFQGYETIKRALKHLFDLENRMNMSEAAHDAFDQMAEDYWPDVRGRSREAASPRDERVSEMRKSMQELLDAADRLKRRMEEADRSKVAALGQNLVER
jgi:prevent-host-death family protein